MGYETKAVSDNGLKEARIAQNKVLYLILLGNTTTNNPIYLKLSIRTIFDASACQKCVKNSSDR